MVAGLGSAVADGFVDATSPGLSRPDGAVLDPCGADDLIGSALRSVAVGAGSTIGAVGVAVAPTWMVSGGAAVVASRVGAVIGADAAVGTEVAVCRVAKKTAAIPNAATSPAPTANRRRSA